MVCQICGKKSRFFELCKECNNLKEDGKITKCESCRKWKKDSERLCHDCQVKVNSSNDKPKTNYTDQDFREKFKEGLKIRTKNGLLVRSLIERIIADFFYDHKIEFEYEPMKLLDGQKYYPDFFIKDIDVYLEHWGCDKPGYVEYRRKKEEAYRKHNVKYISTEKSDVNNIDDKLKIELGRYGLKI